MTQLKKNNYNTFSNSLLSWYDFNRRILPWRAPPGKISNPYFVYLSEIMLQQTVVKTVIPYFLKFVRKWPDINALAKAESHEINSYWAGLGYYSRAKNLHETAKIISNKYDGFFPTDKNSLIALPGIGEYTSSAIMAIAFDRKSNVIDGNVERVFSRFYAVEKPIKESKIFIKNIAEKHLPDNRHGDYAQALMDLGSLICIPKSPRCKMCPLLAICDVGGTTSAKQYPIKLPKNSQEGVYTVSLNIIDSINNFESKKMQIRVIKPGLSSFIFKFAHKFSFIYGLFSAMIAIALGLSAGLIFRRIL